jgi:hypothetical protein
MKLYCSTDSYVSLDILHFKSLLKLKDVDYLLGKGTKTVADKAGSLHQDYNYS